MIATLLFAALLAFQFPSLPGPGPGRHAGGGSNTFGIVQQPTTACSATPCTLTVTATAAGDYGIIYASASFGTPTYITSVSGGGTWTIPAGCQINYSVAVALSCAYTTAPLTAGTTSIQVSWSAAPGGSSALQFWEVSTTGSMSLDAVGTGTAQPNNTSFTGVALTLSGTKDIVIQTLGKANSFVATSVSSPYGNLADTSFYDSASAVNSSTAPAPTWTVGSATSGIPSAIAFK